MRRFLGCERGGVALITAFAITALVGAAGLALDYSRVSSARTQLQAEADAAALSGREGGWINDDDYRVAKSGSVPTSLMAVLGFSDVPISVEAVATFAKPGMIYDEPLLMQLDPDAMDYNQLSVYCFAQDTRRRSQMTVIGDNIGNTFNYAMPVCEGHERLEVRLHNVRMGRVEPQLVNDPNAERYTYHSDDLAVDILETVPCNTLAECRYWSEGGIIPEGPDREPLRDMKHCAPGRYYYYGWEDRPKGDPINDNDFNDIRLIIKCGYQEPTKRRAVRLIK